MGINHCLSSDSKKKKRKMSNMATPHGVSVGLNKGRPITKRKLKTRPSRNRRAGKRTVFARSVIREVAGYAPYERRLQELLKVGLDKRALRLAKKKIGTHKRALKKRDEMQQVVQRQRIADAAASKKTEKEH